MPCGCDPISPLASFSSCSSQTKTIRMPLFCTSSLASLSGTRIISLAACHTARSQVPSSFPESLAHTIWCGRAFVVARFGWRTTRNALAFPEISTRSAKNFFFFSDYSPGRIPYGPTPATRPPEVSGERPSLDLPNSLRWLTLCVGGGRNATLSATFTE